MANCKDIVVVDFPFTEHDGGKKVRPAVIISDENKYGDYVFLPITTSKKQIADAFPLDSSHVEGKPGMELLKLLTMSYVHTEKPMTVKKQHIKKPMVTLTDDSFKKILEKLINETFCTTKE